MSVSALVAKIGTNPYWIAGNAHFWFAAFALFAFPSVWLLATFLLVAAWKEFVFDADNEVPKQTAFDNWTDFAGYALGAGFGFLASGIHQIAL